MIAYALFVKHHVLPSTFIDLSANEKAMVIQFMQKELKDEKEARDKAKKG